MAVRVDFYEPCTLGGIYEDCYIKPSNSWPILTLGVLIPKNVS